MKPWTSLGNPGHEWRVNLVTGSKITKLTLECKPSGAGYVLVYTEHLVVSYNREELNLSFTVCVTASKESF